MVDLSNTPTASEIAASAVSAEDQRFSSVAVSAEFKGKAVRGGAATVMGQGVTMGLQIVTTVVLARLLSPTDYGLQAMVITLTAFFALFKDGGLSVAAIQRDKLTHEQLSTLFWINAGLGTLLMILVAVMAPALADFYKEPRLLGITLASATIFLFNSLAVQHNALLNRAMRFGTTVSIDILACTIGTIVAIGMAALGFGYWSLICQNITLPIVSATATWIAMPWLPGRPRWTSELRSMLRFGGTVTMNGLVVYIAYNTEKILLGRFWGAGPLGIYGRAYQLATLPVLQLIAAIHVVAFSALSRIQDDAQRLRRSYLKSHSVVVALTIPVVISTALFANEIVYLVLGEKWMQAAIVLRLLSPTVLVFALVNPFSWLLKSTGRVGRSLKIALLIAPVVILGILAGLRHGPAGVALGYSGAMVALFVPLVVWSIHRTEISIRDYWQSISRPLFAGVIGSAAGLLLRFALQGRLSAVPLLIVGLIVCFTVYACFLLFVMGQKEMYVDLLSHFLRRNQPAIAKS